MEVLNSNNQHRMKPIDTISLMSETSLKLVKDLDNIYRHNVIDSQKIGGVVLGIFGSGERNEMLPYSDVDTAIFADDGEVIDDLTSDIKALPYDKIDIPIAGSFDVDKLLKLAEENSPDAHSLHLKIIDTSAPNEVSEGLGKIEGVLNSRKSYLGNLIFDYHYLRYRAGKKGSERSPNLKYANGGPRDMLYLDWAASYFTDSGTNKDAECNKVPRIENSIAILSDRIPGVTRDELTWAIDTVNTVKHHALEISHQGGDFDGVLSYQTCENLLKNYDYGDVNNVHELKNQHRIARAAISFTKNAVYNKALKELSEDEFGHDFVARMRDIDAIWANKIDSSARAAAMGRLMHDGGWSSIATVIAQNDASDEQIRSAIMLARQNPAFSHVFRIAAKHPSASNDTLRYLLGLKKIALDDDVDDRYRKIIQERLKADEA